MCFVISRDKYTVSSTSPCDVVADGDAVTSKLWLRTPALDKELISKLAQIQLETKSHDQGWVSFPEAGSWSWFDIVVLDSPEASLPKVKDGLALIWLSHTNELGKEEFTEKIGPILERSHDIFNGLEAGNALAVRVSARFVGWENHASEGRLILRVSEKSIAEPPLPDTSRIEYNTRVAKQISHLRETFDEYLKTITPDGAPPAYSLVGEMLPTGPLRADQETLAEEPPLRLLSFDGGGVRGISSLYILQAIMAKVSSDPNVKPHKYFDMIAGTSTGGLIAIMLGRLKMSIPECIQVYTDLASKIFNENWAKRAWNMANTGAYYSKGNFETALKALIKQKTGDEDAPMRDPDLNNKCKVFVVANLSQDLSNARAEHFRTYAIGIPDPFANCAIWKAARATSAAPLFLPSITIDGVEFVDGGIRFNNPSMLLMGEVNVAYAKNNSADGGIARRISFLLTVGTGMQPNVTINPQPGGPVEVAKYTASLLMATKNLVSDTETTHLIASNLFYDDQVYFRFNAGVRTADGDDWEKPIDLDDWKAMPQLVDLTKRYLEGQTERVEEIAIKVERKQY